MDLGAGDGALTRPLLDAGAHVIAAERTPAARHTRRYVLDVGLPVPRRAFDPPPQVDSAVLRVRRRGRSG